MPKHPESFHRKDRAPRRTTFPLLGLLFALGAPLGLVLLRAIVEGRVPTLGFLLRELRSDPWVYGYVLGSTAFVLFVLGRVLGRREDLLADLATTDALTHLANRAAFDARLSEELSRATRYRSPLALVLIDLDGLKAINDGLGHAAGDAAIQRVADALARTARRSDVSARVGGDEFAILAPAIHAADATALAERVRRELESSPLGVSEAPVTVSAGVAELDSVKEQTARALILAADAALYAAKAEGRNRTVVYDPKAHSLESPSSLVPVEG